MKKASRKDKPLVLDILSQSFHDNQSVNYIIRQDKNKTERIRQLMSYSFEICTSFGEVFLSDDEKASALVVYPEKKRTTLHSTLLDLRLVFRAVGFGNIVKTLKREKLIHSIQPQERMTYLWFIGVDPLAQQKGIGSRLLQEVIAHSNADNRNVLLETSMPRNIPWYEKHGFKQYGELDLGHRLYFFRRDVER